MKEQIFFFFNIVSVFVLFVCMFSCNVFFFGLLWNVRVYKVLKVD